MSAIAKIEIVIGIPITIGKIFGDPDLDRNFTIRYPIFLLISKSRFYLSKCSWIAEKSVNETYFHKYRFNQNKPSGK